MSQTIMTPEQLFAVDCAALLADGTLTPWEKVTRLAALAQETLALTPCYTLGCQEEATYCPVHAAEHLEPELCRDCGEPVPRILCPACTVAAPRS